MDTTKNTGRISRTLPGQYFPVEPGSVCDEHPSLSAVVKIQSETTATKVEYVYACNDCKLKFDLALSF